MSALRTVGLAALSVALASGASAGQSGPGSAPAPCAACAAVTIDPAASASLPARLEGLELLVRVEPGAELASLAALEAIRTAGGRPGLVYDRVPDGQLPSAVAALVSIVVLAVHDEAPLDQTAFEVKRRVTELRAALEPTAAIGLHAPPDTLAGLLTLDVAPYLDFLVSERPVASGLPHWQPEGELTRAGAALESTSSAGRVLWRGAQDPDVLARTLDDLARAATWFPRGLIPSTGARVTCRARAAATWLNPATLDEVAWVPSCPPQALQVSPSGRPAETVALMDGFIVRLPAGDERFSAATDVRADRTLRVEEILARHQAWAARQRMLTRTRISTGAITLTFEAPGFPAPLTIGSEVVMFTEGGDTDIEQRSIRVNGLEYRARDVPKLPLIEPERVAAAPLAIELTSVYRYTLQSLETVNGFSCYVVRFEPYPGRESLFEGTAWIAAGSFAIVRISAVQTNLRGPIVSSEQTDEFAPFDGDLWLLGRSRVRQIYEGAAHRTPIERVVELRQHEINAPDFLERRAAAHASSHVMLRDTPEGFRYLRREPRSEGLEGGAVERVAQPRTHRVRTAIAGVIVDPNITRPLPFAGLSYVDFDLFGTGTQFNGFYGGTFGQLAFSVPSLGGTRWQLAGRAFGIATAFNDRAFRDGREVYEENIRQRPAHASVGVLRPLTPRATVRAAYELDYTHFAAADTTAAAFVVPAPQVVHALRMALDLQRSGWTAGVWWSPAVRSGWRTWGRTDEDDFAPRHRTFQRYGLSLARSRVVTPELVGRIEANWMSGHDLDRFSRYTFGAFDNRLRGYPSALIRYDRGAVARGALAWSVSRRLRLDGFVDSAFVHDPGLGSGMRRFSGIGAAIESPMPFGMLLAAEWGFGIQGRRADGREGTHVFRLTGYKIF